MPSTQTSPFIPSLEGLEFEELSCLARVERAKEIHILLDELYSSLLILKQKNPPLYNICLNHVKTIFKALEEDFHRIKETIKA